ncbi:hypothetical protein PsYK624_044630 [Phanerochaete sordida]|uniref:Alpha/gamma-adaptin-binding protein p34 n=1 Tax=Phanerochaete sordida TaxID=48140 RepID=A0A9P3G6D5_9APHY|nr:hypothetical protein PsYK624_044630 [Phanerochaete sordida]
MASESAACRILVLSSTLDKAQQFVQRVKTLSSDHSGSGDSSATTSTSDVGSTSVPWTIANKYYTADVHFEMREIHTFAGYHASEVPAVIFVWNRGELYRDHVPNISEKLQHYDPEVTLAVRFSDPAKAAVQDDEDGLDEFLSSHGFEYIDGDRSGRQPTQDGTSFSDEDSSGVPGLPRVVDALSTIMWPSLVQSAATGARKSRARELLDWAREEEAEDGLRALIAQDTGAADDGARKSRMQREMDELERWLDEEDSSRRTMDDAQAWATRDADGDADGDADWSDVPTPTIRTPGATGDEEFGFEDDFAEFVGAPMDVSYSYEALRQEPMHTGASYHTLASHSDLSVEEMLNGDDDPDLPSRAEIEEASKRIFGSASLDVPSTSHSRRSPQAKSSSLPQSATSPPQTTFPPPDDDSFSSFEETDDEFEFGAFDLSRVLGALQGMKEEIAGMTDETERRKAAARAALGLVYGLRKEDERGQGPEDL